MKILLTVENLIELAGSKQYVRTLANAFCDMDGGYNHTVVVASRDKMHGPMREEEWDVGVGFCRFRDLTHVDRFDMAILSPFTASEIEAIIYHRINVVHGIVEPERPIPSCHDYVFISEEALNHWIGDVPPGPSRHIVRNAVDCHEFRPRRKASDQVECIAHFSNYSELPGLREFCETKGIKFLRIKNKSYEAVHAMLDEADLVFAVGRSAYEAMAAGCEVAFADNRGYYDSDTGWCDGIASRDYKTARAYNCSGRARKLPVSTALYQRIIDAYHPLAGLCNRELAIEHHDHIKIAKQLLALVP